MNQTLQNLSDQEIQAAIRHSETIGKFHDYLKSNNRFPHSGQLKVIRAFFRDKKRMVFAMCGRKWGKSECILYIAWRYAIENPGANVYIIAPTKKHGKDLYWVNKRLQSYGCKEFISEERDSEISLVFNIKNQNDIPSRIFVEGSENYNSLRGINPDLVIYDEGRDHQAEFDIEVMRPNLAAKNASLVVISTPPDSECHYIEMMKEWLLAVENKDPSYFFISAPSSDNPIIDKIWLEKEKARLYSTGQGAVYEREYNAKYVPGGASAVLPMWQGYKDKIIKPKKYIENLIQKDKKRMDWFTISDPAQSCFAVLLLGHNRYTSQLFVVDSIYEKDRLKTSASKIFPRVMEKALSWYPNEDKWEHWYDPAAAWYQVEVYDKFGIGLSSVKKRGLKKDPKALDSKISLIKDIITRPNTLFICEEVSSLPWEWDNWVYKPNGELPDKNDHQIDNFFYALEVTKFSVQLEVDPEFSVEAEEKEAKKGFSKSIESVIRDIQVQEDPFAFSNENWDKDAEQYYDE